MQIMDLQTKKILFMEQFLAIRSESIVDKLNTVLKKEWNKDVSKEVTEEYKSFINERILSHENDPNKGMSWQEAQKRIESSL